MKNTIAIDIDGIDIIICVCLVGGFFTANWLPLVFFIGFAMVK